MLAVLKPPPMSIVSVWSLRPGPLAVITPAAFAVFQDHGYRGLYGGLDQAALAARRNLPAAALTDHMDTEELAANLFRESLVRGKLRREGLV